MLFGSRSRVSQEEQSDRLSKVGDDFQSRFDDTRSIDYLNAAITAQRDAVNLTKPRDPVRMVYLAKLSSALHVRFQKTGSIDDLNEAVSATREAVESFPSHSSHRFFLSDLSMLLIARFDQTGSKEDLDAAVKAAQEVVELVPDAPDENDQLGVALAKRFERTGSITDANAAVEAATKAVETAPMVDRAAYLSNKGAVLMRRFQRTGLINDLNTSIEGYEEALTLSRDGDPNQVAVYLGNLSSTLSIRFDRTGSMDDLHSAVRAAEEAVGLLPNDPSCLVNLSGTLSRRFDQGGRIDDLNKAIEAIQEAIKLIPKNNVHRYGFLGNLSGYFIRRFEQTGYLEDLNTGVREAYEIVEETLPEDPYRPLALANLGVALSTRFESTRSLDDLNAAVSKTEEATRLTPVGHFNRHSTLNTLAHALFRRFEVAGSTDDLNAAIGMFEESVQLTRNGHSNLIMYLCNIGLALTRRFDRTRQVDDLSEAIKWMREGKALNPQSRTRILSINLASALAKRGEHVRSTDDLNESVALMEEVLEATPRDDRRKSLVLSVLAYALTSRFQLLDSMDDLDAAIKVNEEAATSTPDNQANGAEYLKRLGLALQRRGERTDSMDDMCAAVDAYEKSAGSPFSPPTTRIESAVCAASLHYAQGRTKEASHMLATALQLLPTSSPRTLHRTDQQFSVSRFVGLAADACALSVRSGDDVYESLRRLELGRGIIAGNHLEMRSDLTLLEDAYPQEARRFRLLRDELDQVEDALSHPSKSGSYLDSRRHEASKEFDALLRMIRSKNGFERFLLGPSGGELKRFASAGPIVFINTSRYGSDAFLVTTDNIQSISLPRLDYLDLEINLEKLLKAIKDDRLATRSQTNASVTEILRWLWDTAAEPILSALGFTETPKSDDDWPHVWWIPVGPLSLFPIHAAGYHSESGRRTVLDRVISSYIPTAKALDHAANQLRRSSSMSSQTVLLVSMETTPHRSRLEFAAEEVSGINTILPHSIERTILSTPSKSEVLKKLEKCSIAHFACHGETNPDPSKSRILFSDWEVNSSTVADMAGKALDHCELAYLSICHAANSQHLGLLDESIHIAGAFQLAGFPAVIGSLWHIADKRSSEVAICVYRAMLTNENKLDIRNIARGLHFAVREMRDKLLKESKYRTSDPLTWAPYLHVGV